MEMESVTFYSITLFFYFCSKPNFHILTKSSFKGNALCTQINGRRPHPALSRKGPEATRQAGQVSPDRPWSRK